MSQRLEIARVQHVYRYVWLALAVYVVALGIATHLPPLGLRKLLFSVPRGIAISDKLMHACAYSGLTLLVWLVWRVRHATTSRLEQRVGLAVIVLCVAIFGLLDEATQPLVGREFDWLDWAANLCGMSIALLTAAWLGQSSIWRSLQSALARW